MKTIFQSAVLATILIFSSTTINAQILGRVFDRAADKISDRISDEISDAIARELEKKLMKSVDDAMDDMLKERYQRDSLDGSASGSYNDFLKAFLTPVDLPESYTFDMVLHADTRDYDGEKNKIEFMVTKDGSLLGVKSYQDDEDATIIFDMKNDIMVTYQIEDGEKQVLAMPNMLSVGGAFVKANIDEEDMETTMEKTGKTKKIEGHKCNEWKIDSEETVTRAYIAEDFPISWKDSHSQFLSQVMPTTKRDDLPEGMALKSESKTKKKGKKSSFLVTKIDDAAYTINNGDYKQITYGEEEN